MFLVLRFLFIIFLTTSLFLAVDLFFGRSILSLLNKKTDGKVILNYKDEKLGLIFKKNQKITNAQWGPNYYIFCTNDLGLKSKCDSKSSNSYKYAFIGDSFTEGIGLKYEDTFVGLFDKKYGNTINFAISGTSPIIHIKRLKYFLNEKNIEIKNLFLFFDLTDFEDEYGWKSEKIDYLDNYEIDMSREKYKLFLKNNLPITYNVLLNIWWNYFRGFLVKEDSHIRYNDKRYDWDYKKINEINDYFLKKKILSKSINDIIQLSIDNNFKLHLVIYPHPGTIMYLKDINNSNNISLIDELCGSNDACSLINLYDDFYNELKNLEKINLINKYYFKGDLHFNMQGNRFVYKNFISKLDINK